MADSSVIDVAQTVGRLLRDGSVKVDGRAAMSAPSAGEIENVFEPLLRWCDERRHPIGRGVAGIAGPPGAGKSHVLAWLAATARALNIGGVAFVSMDGYHLPDAILRTRTFIDPAGESVPLQRIKGTPPSFDADKLLTDLRLLKSSRAEVRLPMYSRELHEPLADAVGVGPEIDWIFIEGNFLFLPLGPWSEIDPLLSRRIFIDGAAEMLRDRLLRRHACSGRDPAAFDAQYRRVDEPNDRLIRSTRCRADLIWEWSAEGCLKVVSR